MLRKIFIPSLIFFIAGMLILHNFLSCSGTDRNRQDKERTVTDMQGRKVQLPDSINRIVGLEAGALRLIAYMQSVDRVVGVEDIEHRTSRPYNYAYPELAEKPVIGPVHGGDAELITAQNPDVIFWTYTTAGKADELQRKTGIPVITLQYGNFNDRMDTLFAALQLMGKIMHKQERAQTLIAYIRQTINGLDKRTATIPDSSRPTAYAGGISYRGGHGIVSTEPDYAPFRFTNTPNVAAELGPVRISPGGSMEQAMVDKEQIITWNPDYLFVDAMNLPQVLEDIEANPALSRTLKAVRENRCYTLMPYNYYTTNFATVLANAFFVGKTLYPHHFRDVDIREQAGAIYKNLLGADVYPEMAGEYGHFRRLRLDPK